jgi:hypothetical protein
LFVLSIDENGCVNLWSLGYHRLIIKTPTIVFSWLVEERVVHLMIPLTACHGREELHAIHGLFQTKAVRGRIRATKITTGLHTQDVTQASNCLRFCGGGIVSTTKSHPCTIESLVKGSELTSENPSVLTFPKVPTS